MLAGEVIELGLESGFTLNQIKQARKRSTSPKIYTYKSGFQGSWVWTLANPEDQA